MAQESPITAEDRPKLDAAYAALVRGGHEVTAEALQEATGVGSGPAETYQRQCGELPAIVAAISVAT